ncbi:hypothetical protein D3C74_325940 [compost metagenome]
MSWLISRIDRMGFSSAMSRMGTPASIMRRIRSVAPTLSMVVVSAMDESPTITCRRRYCSASAWGSSRVLMMGRERVVALETDSQMWSARCDSAKIAPRGVARILPAPVSTWRVMRNGTSTSESREKSPWRRTR